MFKKARQKAHDIKFVQIKPAGTGELRKLHSNLYEYSEGDCKIQFVANTATPAVNGYVVCVNARAATFMTQGQFEQEYVEEA